MDGGTTSVRGTETLLLILVPFLPSLPGFVEVLTPTECCPETPFALIVFVLAITLLLESEMLGLAAERGCSRMTYVLSISSSSSFHEPFLFSAALGTSSLCRRASHEHSIMNKSNAKTLSRKSSATFSRQPTARNDRSILDRYSSFS